MSAPDLPFYAYLTIAFSLFNAARSSADGVRQAVEHFGDLTALVGELGGGVEQVGYVGR